MLDRRRLVLLALAFAVFSFFLSCCGHAQQLVEPVTRKRDRDEDELEVLATSSSVKKLLRTHEGRLMLGTQTEGVSLSVLRQAP